MPRQEANEWQSFSPSVFYHPLRNSWLNIQTVNIGVIFHAQTVFPGAIDYFSLSTLSISFHIRLMLCDFSRPLKNMLMPFILESHATVLDTFEFLIKVLIKISQLSRLNRFVKLQIMRRLHILRCDKNLSQLPLDIWGYTIYTKNASKHLLIPINFK